MRDEEWDKLSAEEQADRIASFARCCIMHPLTFNEEYINQAKIYGGSGYIGAEGVWVAISTR